MKTGQLGKQDYIRERQEANGLKIEPFNQTVDLKLASYDITPTMIAMSTKLGMLETVYQAKDTSLYIKVRAKDTVLVVSNEYFSVPPDMAGYVVSRVSKVADGFGHVSTSIDPKHGEEKALTKVPELVPDGCLFTTSSPCEMCSKNAKNHHIKKIYYIEQYPGISADQYSESGYACNRAKHILFTGAIGRAYVQMYTPIMPHKDVLKFMGIDNKLK